MAKKLTVTTEIGTFTRQTARPYTYVVVANGGSDWAIREHLKFELDRAKSNVEYWTAVRDFERDAPLNYTVTPNRPYSAVEVAAELAKNQALVDQIESGQALADQTAKAAAAPFAALTWCSRLDLARKEQRTWAARFREVRIYDVATGQVVR